MNHPGGTATAGIILSGSGRRGRAAQDLDEVTLRAVMSCGNTETRQSMHVAGHPGRRLQRHAPERPRRRAETPPSPPVNDPALIGHRRSFQNRLPRHSQFLLRRWTTVDLLWHQYRTQKHDSAPPIPRHQTEHDETCPCTPRRSRLRLCRILNLDGSRLCGNRNHSRNLSASQQPWKPKSELRSLRSTPSCQSTRWVI